MADLVPAFLESYRLRYEEGDAGALLEAVSWCLVQGLLPPSWARDAFVPCVDRMKHDPRVRSLDTAFRYTLPKGKHTDTLKQRQDKQFRIYDLVEEARAGGESTTNVFHLVSQMAEVNVSESTCRKLYYAERKARLQADHDAFPEI